MNTINLLSAISVLACNVSMASIPKQANTSNYGDIVVLNRDIIYQDANSLQSDNGLIGDNRIVYYVTRQIGNYSDDRINFYTERYTFTSYWGEDSQVIKVGFAYFFTLDIYNSTLLTSLQIRQNLNSSSNPSISGSYHQDFYNLPLTINNLPNTLYFENYNLNWDSTSDLPKVANANSSYLNLSHTNIREVNGPCNSIFDWPYIEFVNNDNLHGSINYSNVDYITLSSTIYDGQFGFNPTGCNLVYKYMVNNPTYEVIDLPNVMLSILTMPFTFFSQAFNLTLFPNTPYAINVGHTILIIVGVIGTIYLIKYLVSIFKG